MLRALHGRAGSQRPVWRPRMAGIAPRPARGRVQTALPALAGASAAALAGARGYLFPFVPVCLGLGVAAYFALPAEPGQAAWAGLAACLLAGALLWWRGPEPAQPLFAAFALVAAGLCLTGARAHWVAAPVLEGRYYGAVEGRVVAIDRGGSDALRITLDRVVLERAPHRTPARVRIALHGGAADWIALAPGQRVMTTAHLSAPPAPAEPGGFDFRRMAWFDRLGAVGYTRSPVVEAGPPDRGAARLIDRLRHALSQTIRTALPGQTGAFAAAILTGDRSGIDAAVTEALRASNLSHLLAISGLHMGLLTGFVFAALRSGGALVPPLALRLDLKKAAAVGALAAGAVYLALSGGNVATERAYVMVAVMLVAVLLDRRAISLRSVAVAATILLCLRPEEILSAGFQMSFAATIALVAVFGLLRDRRNRARAAGRPWRRRRWTDAVAGVVLCSVVAGIATAPVAAAQFNRVADYGLLANLLAVPLMGSVIIPAAVIAAILAPVGLAWLPLTAMDLGIRWVLAVAHWVAGLDGAVRAVVAPPGWVLPVLALGALWLVLWPGRLRWSGLAALAVAAAGWWQTARPVLIVADSGTVLGVMTPEGRALVGGGQGFAVESWLEDDGDGATADAARARATDRGWTAGAPFSVAGHEIVLLRGRDALERLDTACRNGRFVVLEAVLPAPQRAVAGTGGGRSAAAIAPAVDSASEALLPQAAAPGPGGAAAEPSGETPAAGPEAAVPPPTGRGAAAAAQAAPAPAARPQPGHLGASPHPAFRPWPEGDARCAVADARALRASGALSLALDGGRSRWRSVADASGRRPWTGAAARPR